jgi:hypothetical protein
MQPDPFARVTPFARLSSSMVGVGLQAILVLLTLSGLDLPHSLGKNREGMSTINTSM